METDKRKFENIKTLDDVLNVLGSTLKNNKLKLKYEIEESFVQIHKIQSDKSIVIGTNPSYQPIDETIIVYGLMDKYIEIDFQVMSLLEPGIYVCKIKSVRKAIEGRRDIRFNVTPEIVTATNFLISKHTIDIINFQIPTRTKVLLEQFVSQNLNLADIVTINIYDNIKDDVIISKIRKTGKILFIHDVSNPESYKSDSEDFLDLSEILGADLKKYIHKNLEKGYHSILISPIMLLTESQESVSFAYLKIISKSELFDIEKVHEIKEILLKLVDKIKDANTQLVKTSQEIINLSKGGVQLKITDNDLKKYIQRTKGFIFDIVFKLQAPVTVFGEIRHTSTDKDGNLFLGIDFTGRSSRKDEIKRYYSYIQPMEIAYKEKILLARKLKKKIQS